MCGICGHVHPDSADPAIVERMALTLNHRGPDGCGLFHDRQIALGATRLAIIDVAAGVQPIFSEDRQIAVVFNGEIYNYQTLRAELESRGHQFATHTDTEVLVHGYEAWGLDLLNRLRGMFAFALWDKRQAWLLLARDRMGEKPLYYTQIGESVLFASEIKALFAHPDVPRAVNEEVLSVYLTLGYVPPPATLFQSIQKLAPGEYAIVQDGQIRTARYWQPHMDTTASDLTYAEAVQQTRDRLIEAVEMRLMSDVPLGALLSGGLDSAAVVAIASSRTQRPFSTFTVAFDFEDNSTGSRKFNADRDYAALVAERYQTDHHVLTIRQTPQIAELLPRLIHALDEPIVQPGIVPSVCAAALARQHGIPVLLTGDGGDELFAGYTAYRADRQVERYLALPALLRKGVLNPLLERSPWASGRTIVQKSQHVDPIDRYLNWQRMVSPNQFPDLLADQHLVKNARSRLASALSPLLAAPRTRHFADRIAFTGLNLWLPEDSNMRVDKMSMAMSIETRAPFEDHHLVDFAFGLPLSYKLRDGDFKRVLKDAVRDLVPAEILTRPKWGFIPPASEWLRTILRPLVDRYLSPENVAAVGLFNPQMVSRLIERHNTRQSYELWTLWPLLIFHIWHALYIENRLTYPSPLTPDEVLALAT